MFPVDYVPLIVKQKESDGGEGDGSSSVVEGDKYGRTCAITLFGRARVLKNHTKESEGLRRKHMAHNPDSAQVLSLLLLP